MVWSAHREEHSLGANLSARSLRSRAASGLARRLSDCRRHARADVPLSMARAVTTRPRGRLLRSCRGRPGRRRRAEGTRDLRSPLRRVRRGVLFAAHSCARRISGRRRGVASSDGGPGLSRCLARILRLRRLGRFVAAALAGDRSLRHAPALLDATGRRVRVRQRAWRARRCAGRLLRTRRRRAGAVPQLRSLPRRVDPVQGDPPRSSRVVADLRRHCPHGRDHSLRDEASGARGPVDGGMEGAGRRANGGVGRARVRRRRPTRPVVVRRTRCANHSGSRAGRHTADVCESRHSRQHRPPGGVAAGGAARASRTTG